MRLFASDIFDSHKVESKTLLLENIRGSYRTSALGNDILLTSRAVVNHISALAPGKDVRNALNSFVDSQSGWMYIGDEKSKYFKLAKQIVRNLGNANPPIRLMFRVGDLQSLGPEASKDLFYQRWMQVLGQDLIPFDPDQRKKLITRASKVIGKRIKFVRSEIEADSNAEKEMDDASRTYFEVFGPFSDSADYPASLGVDMGVYIDFGVRYEASKFKIYSKKLASSDVSREAMSIFT